MSGAAEAVVFVGAVKSVASRGARPKLPTIIIASHALGHVQNANYMLRMWAKPKRTSITQHPGRRVTIVQTIEDAPVRSVLSTCCCYDCACLGHRHDRDPDRGHRGYPVACHRDRRH